MGKRLFDIACAATALVLLVPLLLVLALWVRLDSPGPVLFRQQRVGRGGRPFAILKFRTMQVNAEAAGLQITVGQDPRITRTGRWLRRSKLDELPQLLNVLRGEMSLIGPRPCLQYEYEHFDEWHKLRFQITPGMTGLWQVLGRNKQDVTFNDSVMLDLYYIQHCSLWLDLKIILKTIPIVLFGRGGA